MILGALDINYPVGAVAGWNFDAAHPFGSRSLLTKQCLVAHTSAGC